MQQCLHIAGLLHANGCGTPRGATSLRTRIRAQRTRTHGAHSGCGAPRAWCPQYAIQLAGAQNEKWTEEDRLQPIEATA